MDLTQIRHVAELAELSLSEAEETRLAQEIGKIVAYVAELDAIDTSDVPPTAHIAAVGHAGEGWRADEPQPGIAHDDALAGAPRADHDGFSVPTFVGS